jgi:hypothetical protein
MTRSRASVIAVAVVLCAAAVGGCASRSSTAVSASPPMLYQPAGYPMYTWPPGVTPASYAEALARDPYLKSPAISRPYVIGRDTNVQAGSP